MGERLLISRTRESQPAHLAPGRASRRRFLALAIVVGSLASVAFAPEAASATRAHQRRGAIMARQNDASDDANGHYLTAPGARLYYEVSGSGPVLLLIPGGPVDAEGFAPMLEFLEPHYTVLRYDPRGISRSTLDGPAEDVPVEVHADDAALVLEAVGTGSAFVLGSSGGAVIGLALAERHPDLVQTVVAHEPPLVNLLPEGDPRRDANQAIYDLYLQEGAGPAMAQFMAVAELDEPAPEDLSPEAQQAMAEAMARIEPNIDFFLGHYLMPISTYLPDIAALQSGPSRVVVGVGETSGDQEAAETARALAERLGTEAVVFPGDHMGMTSLPEAFVETLSKVY